MGIGKKCKRWFCTIWAGKFKLLYLREFSTDSYRFWCILKFSSYILHFGLFCGSQQQLLQAKIDDYNANRD